MTKNFQFSSPPSVDEMAELIEQMREVLDALSHREIPGEQYTIEDLKHYCQSLISSQRGSLGLTRPDSWSVAENDVDMPADARVDFIFVPTYVAVATLTKVRIDYSYIAAAIPGYDDALRRGMIFATHRRLEGHGYDATRGLIDAALIFAEGGVAEFLSSNEDFCPELLDVLREVKRTLTDQISSGQTAGVWGEEYKSDFLSVVETLRLASIPGMEASIKSGMEEPLEDSKEEIEW